MNENINLCEILKDCPKGTKLYSSVIGEVEFVRIDYDPNYPIDCRSEEAGNISFTKKGQYFKGGECTIFPSREERDWSKWQCPKPKFDPKTLQPFDRVLVKNKESDWSKWKCSKSNKSKFDPNTLKPFDKILVRDANDREWNAVLFSHNNTKGKVIVAGYVWTQVIPYNNDTKHLVGTPGEPPEYYKYWEI